MNGSDVTPAPIDILVSNKHADMCFSNYNQDKSYEEEIWGAVGGYYKKPNLVWSPRWLLVEMVFTLRLEV